MPIIKIFINYLFLLLFGFHFVQSHQGFLCSYHGESKASGTCELIKDCPFMIHRIINYFDCGTKGDEILVCCPYTLMAKTAIKINHNLRIHEKKCLEYKLKVFGEMKNQCENRQELQQSNNYLAKPKEFPHMALIGFVSSFDNNKIDYWRCGGTLISDHFVLTAGHCLYSREFGKPKIVRLGELDLQNDYDDAQPEDYNIEKIILHPNYKINLKYNDIALIKLNRLVKFNLYIYPACLPTNFNQFHKNAIVTGWGSNNNININNNMKSFKSKHMKKILLETFSYKECNKIYNYAINKSFRYGILDSIQLCAGSRNSSYDSCYGDSGGPLQIYNNNSDYCMYTVIGIISFGYSSCGNAGIPGVYTRVFPYINWIENIVW